MSEFNHLKSHFLLNPEITFLNFGSFGATPKSVFERYQTYQADLERDPVQFITVKTPQLLRQSREALAGFLHCDADDLVMVTNPSYAVNTIAKSLNLEPGDEILTTNVEYGACDRAWDYVCASRGAYYVQQPITLPLTSDEKFMEELFEGVSNQTKLIFISHITSATALILPVEKVIKKANSYGIPVFIDGAHVPGHIHLDLQQLDPDFYTGACHKWLMTPKGSSFMYVNKAWQEQIFPLAVSWGYKAVKPSHSQFIDWHEMNGTNDYAARLCIPEALKFRKDYNWDDVAQQCRTIVQSNADIFAGLLHSHTLAPVTDQYIGQMLSVPIQTNDPDKLYRSFVDEYKIEIPVMHQNGINYLRYSINGFNSQADLDRLFEVIEQIIKKGLIQ